MHTSNPVLSLDVVGNGRDMSTMLDLTRASGIREDTLHNVTTIPPIADNIQQNLTTESLKIEDIGRTVLAPRKPPSLL